MLHFFPQRQAVAQTQRERKPLHQYPRFPKIRMHTRAGLIKQLNFKGSVEWRVLKSDYSVLPAGMPKLCKFGVNFGFVLPLSLWSLEGRAKTSWTRASTSKDEDASLTF